MSRTKFPFSILLLLTIILAIQQAHAQANLVHDYPYQYPMDLLPTISISNQLSEMARLGNLQYDIYCDQNRNQDSQLQQRKDLFNTIYPIETTITYKITKGNIDVPTGSTIHLESENDDENDGYINAILEDDESESKPEGRYIYPSVLGQQKNVYVTDIIDQKSEGKPLQYEFTFKTTDLKKDLPKFDKQIEEFVRNQVNIYQRGTNQRYNYHIGEAINKIDGFSVEKLIIEEEAVSKKGKMNFLDFDNFNNLITMACKEVLPNHRNGSKPIKTSIISNNSTVSESVSMIAEGKRIQDVGTNSQISVNKKEEEFPKEKSTLPQLSKFRSNGSKDRLSNTVSLSGLFRTRQTLQIDQNNSHL